METGEQPGIEMTAILPADPGKKALRRLQSIVKAIQTRRRNEQSSPFLCEILDCSEDLQALERVLSNLPQEGQGFPSHQFVCRLSEVQWVVVDVRVRNHQPFITIVDCASNPDTLQTLLDAIAKHYPQAKSSYQPMSESRSCVYGPKVALKKAIAFSGPSVSRSTAFTSYLPYHQLLHGGFALRWSLFASEEAKREHPSKDCSPARKSM